MRELLDAGLIDGDAMTVTGRDDGRGARGRDALGRPADAGAPLGRRPGQADGRLRDPLGQPGAGRRRDQGREPGRRTATAARPRSSTASRTPSARSRTGGSGPATSSSSATRARRAAPGMPEMTHLTAAIVGAGLAEERRAPHRRPVRRRHAGNLGRAHLARGRGRGPARDPPRRRHRRDRRGGEPAPRRAGRRRDRRAARRGRAPGAALPDGRAREVRAPRRLGRDRGARRGLSDERHPHLVQRVLVPGRARAARAHRHREAARLRPRRPRALPCRRHRARRRPGSGRRPPAASLDAHGLASEDLFLSIGATVEEIAPNQRDPGLRERGRREFAAAARVASELGHPGAHVLPGVSWAEDAEHGLGASASRSSAGASTRRGRSASRCGSRRMPGRSSRSPSSPPASAPRCRACGSRSTRRISSCRP